MRYKREYRLLFLDEVLTTIQELGGEKKPLGNWRGYEEYELKTKTNTLVVRIKPEEEYFHALAVDMFFVKPTIGNQQSSKNYNFKAPNETVEACIDYFNEHINEGLLH